MIAVWRTGNTVAAVLPFARWSRASVSHEHTHSTRGGFFGWLNSSRLSFFVFFSSCCLLLSYLSATICLGFYVPTVGTIPSTQAAIRSCGRNFNFAYHLYGNELSVRVLAANHRMLVNARLAALKAPGGGALCLCCFAPWENKECACMR